MIMITTTITIMMILGQGRVSALRKNLLAQLPSQKERELKVHTQLAMAMCIALAASD